MLVSLEEKKSEEELLDLLSIVMSLDSEVKKDLSLKLLSKLLNKMQVGLKVNGYESYKIIKALKKKGDYDELLKGSLLSYLAEKYKVADEKAYLKMFGKNFEKVGEYHLVKGNQKMFMENMELAEKVFREEGEFSKADEIKERRMKV